jgi:hypothetical protein
MKKFLLVSIVAAVGFCGGAAALPKDPPKCHRHQLPPQCVTKTTVCPPPNTNTNVHGPGQQQPCVPKTYQQCTPGKWICD